MSYSDPKYYTRDNYLGNDGLTSTATITASAHVVTNTDIAAMPNFNVKTKINALKIRINTAPHANATGTTFVFLNGTNTAASAVIGTNTANVYVSATMTAVHSTFTAGQSPTISVLSTGTASTGAVTQGNYDVWYDVSEQF